MRRPKRGLLVVACGVLAFGAAGCESDFYYSSSGFRCNEPTLGYQHSSCGGGDGAAIFYGILIGIWAAARIVEELAHGCH